MSDLDRLVREIVREEIAAAVELAAIPDEWLSHAEAADMLGITPGHLYNKLGQVPSHKAAGGGRRRYRRSELNAYLAGQS